VKPVDALVKVGGSLLGWPEFPARLRAYLDGQAGRRVVLVVGGGRFADEVRRLDSVFGIGEKRSHGLALLSLDLSARVACAVVPGLVTVEEPAGLGVAFEGSAVPVVLPRRFLEKLGAGPLPECWDVTTDSIAARLGEALGAHDLTLIKSTGSGGFRIREAAARAGIVDAWFPHASRRFARVSIVNLRAEPPTTDVLE
jgi:aspartokinase-like uncharacterized kinase